VAVSRPRDQRRLEGGPHRAGGGEFPERSPEARFRTLPHGLRVHRPGGARTGGIAQQMGIAPIELREKTTYEAGPSGG